MMGPEHFLPYFEHFLLYFEHFLLYFADFPANISSLCGERRSHVPSIRRAMSAREKHVISFATVHFLGFYQ